MRPFSLCALALCCLLYACADNSPQPSLPSDNKDSLLKAIPEPNLSDEPMSDSINPNVWNEAKAYGRSICLCGQKVFPIQEEKLASELPTMNEEQRQAHQDKFYKRLEPLREDFSNCKSEAMDRFRDSSNYEQNLLTRQQGDSLNLMIRAGFNEAGCGKFARVSQLLFDKNAPLSYD